MPGYTHLQRAQPVYLSHHLLAYVWMLIRDRDRFADVVSATASLPLGAGALAGVNFDTDRELVARELGFASVAENSIDAVSNRDFVLDYLAAAATCATHLSRLGGEIVLWSSEEFGFCEVADAWASGSSIMPQKKNPDAAELLRAKAPRVAAHLVALHGVLHGLPLTYNKDMQEDKEHLFDAVDTVELCLDAADGMLSSITLPSRPAGRRRPPTSCWRRPTSPTCWCGAACRSARRTGSWPGWSGPRSTRASRCPRSPPSELAEHSPLLDDEFYAVLRDGAWLETKVLARAGRAWHACASSSSGRGPRSDEARVLRSPGPRGGARPDRLRGLARRVRRRDRRDRGVSPLRARLPRVRRPDQSHSRPVRAARVRLLYRSYGIHACLNAVCEPEGVGAAVLIRALEPVEGIEVMRERRGLERVENLCSGPGKLTQALGIGLELNGSDLIRGPIVIARRPPAWRDVEVAASRRIGITKAVELPWRFSAVGSRYLSRPALSRV